MFDFIKILIIDAVLINSVWNNPVLIFHSNTERRVNDEIRIYRKKTFQGLTFTLFENRLEIKGSLHYFFNTGIHNANDFSFKACIDVISMLKVQFALDLDKCEIKSLEYGLNVIPSESVKNVVAWLKFHERNEFRSIKDLQHAKQASSFNAYGKNNNYKIAKGYAKGLQRFDGYVQNNYNTFRFEIRSLQRKYFCGRLKISTLQDLLNPEIYYVLATELLKEWDNVLMMDGNLPRAGTSISKYTSLDFWENCLREHRNKILRHKKNYFKLLKDYPENIHSHIRKLLQLKLELFTNELKSSAHSTLYENIHGAHSTLYEISDNSKKNADSIIVKVKSAPLNINCVSSKLSFPDCNKKGSKYLSEKNVKWYFENKPKIYYEKLDSLLTGKWKAKHRNEPFELRFVEIAHQLRNIDRNPLNNPRNNAKRSIKNLESKNGGNMIFLLQEIVDPKILKLITSKN